VPAPPWYPYAPDQQFGVRAATDEATLDRLLANLDAQRTPVPRAGNKAPVVSDLAEPRAPGRVWPTLAGRSLDLLAGPVTTATALDAAPRMRTDA
jgi:hypothetical protein